MSTTTMISTNVKPDLVVWQPFMTFTLARRRLLTIGVPAAWGAYRDGVAAAVRRLEKYQ